MDANLLHVVSVISNPLRWDSRLRLTKNFIEHMLDSGVNLTIVETEYGERPFQLDKVPHIKHIPTRAATMAWGKESAANVGIRALPPDAKYVAWIDADIEFRRSDWAAESVHTLQMYPVAQPWSEALDLGPQGEIMMVKGTHVQRSFGWVWREFGNVVDGWKKQFWDDPYPPYGHSGYAWIATMEFFNQIGGLVERSGAGAADHQQALAFVGEVDRAIHGLSSDSYKAYVKSWGERAFAACQGRVGYVPGRIEHSFHGRKTRRKYVERWDILTKHKFDPMTDVHLNRWGILELSNNKPALRRDLEAYFSGRNEDENTLD